MKELQIFLKIIVFFVDSFWILSSIHCPKTNGKFSELFFKVKYDMQKLKNCSNNKIFFFFFFTQLNQIFLIFQINSNQSLMSPSQFSQFFLKSFKAIFLHNYPFPTILCNILPFPFLRLNQVCLHTSLLLFSTAK